MKVVRPERTRERDVDCGESYTCGNMHDGSLETEVVLDCIRRHFGCSPRHEGVENKPTARPDWNRVMSIAAYHGVIPLVRASLCDAATSAIPRDARRRIEHESRRWAANSLLYGHELARIQDRLNSSGMRVIAFKGPTLATRLYGKLGQRQLRDLDLMFAKPEIKGALEVLRSSGYRIDACHADWDDAFRTDKHLLLVHKDSATKIELHWAVALPDIHFDLPFNVVWDRREYVSMLGTRVATPCMNDLLLILSVHGTSHYWISLKWVCDIAALIRKYPDADWMALRAEAKKFGCYRMVLLALALARNVIGGVLPSAAEREIEEDAAVNILAQEARARFYTMGRLDFFERLFTHIRSREQFIHRTQIAASYVQSVLARNNGQRLRLPSFLNSLSWPARMCGVRVRSWDKLTPLLAAVIDHIPRHHAPSTH